MNQQLDVASNTQGTLNYLANEVTPSLFRNGKVLIRRNSAGSDSKATGLNFSKATVEVANARLGASSPTLNDNGFELVMAPLEDDLDFFNQSQVLTEYYQSCTQLVAKITGGRAFAFDHNIRSASGKQQKQQIKNGQEVQGPAHAVHGDYTLTSAPQRLRDLTQPPGINDTISKLLAPSESLLDENLINKHLTQGKRFSIINVWRNIVADPVVTHPMAFCDGRTVKPEELVVFEIHYADRIGENYFARYSDQHRWYYYPQVTSDEAILIKQWDSAGHLATTQGLENDAAVDGPCTFSFHSAFADPNTNPDAPDRWSMEVRCMVLFD